MFERYRIWTAPVILFAVVLTVVVSVTTGAVTSGAREAGDLPFLRPSPAHPLGTDELGRDILGSLIQGAGTSLLVGFAAAFLATALGTCVGIAAGYLGGRTDTASMWLCNVFFLIPGLPLLIILASFLKPGLTNIVFGIALLGWAGTARVVRSRVQQIRGMSFILASRAMGAPHSHVMLRHLVPHIGEIILARASLAVSNAMIAEAGLCFVGLGDPTRISWGTILYKAFTHGAVVNGFVWWYLPPILCITLTVFLFATLSLRGTINPEAARMQSPITPVTPAVPPAERAGAPAPQVLHAASEGVVLRVQGLHVDFRDGDGSCSRVLEGIDLEVREGEKVALVGETGGGKSVLLLALVRLLPGNARISGTAWYRGLNLFECGGEEMRKLRGRKISYLPQALGNALNPVLRIRTQVAEPTVAHGRLFGRSARNEALRLLRRAGLQDAETIASDYPHRLSGGMKQRVLAAMALACDADLLLVDEPTKGLDRKKRDELLELFQDLASKTILLVTHDLGFAERWADRILVMYSSRIVEAAPRQELFSNPLHPYSQALVAALPSRGMMDWTGDGPAGAKSAQSGCPFRPACRRAFERCPTPPPLVEENGRWVRCWLHAP